MDPAGNLPPIRKYITAVRSGCSFDFPGTHIQKQTGAAADTAAPEIPEDHSSLIVKVALIVPVKLPLPLITTVAVPGPMLFLYVTV